MRHPTRAARPPALSQNITQGGIVIRSRALAGLAAGAVLVPATTATAPALAALSPAPLPGGGDAANPLLRIAKRPFIARDVHLAARLAHLRGTHLRTGYRSAVRTFTIAQLRRHVRTLRHRIAAERRRSVASPALQAIARCESGGNPRADTGNGFYGKYQFTLQTWQAMGGSGNPARASEREQDRRAARVMAVAGAGQWPVCGR